MDMQDRLQELAEEYGTASFEGTTYIVLDDPSVSNQQIVRAFAICMDDTPDEQGRISQSTEEIVGPYELHDFFIYNMLRYGFGPEKLLFLAEKAWGGRFDRQTILKWLRFFCKKFFSQQFKRSCSPDGAGVTAISLSPRAGFRMPSDASASVWLRELDRLG